MTEEDNLYRNVNKDDLCNCVFEWGSDPELIEDREYAEQIAEIINNASNRGIIYTTDDDYAIYSAKLGGNINSPIYTFVNGSEGSYAKI